MNSHRKPPETGAGDDSTPASSPRSWWSTASRYPRTAATLGAALALVLFHGTVLGAVGRWLVDSDPRTDCRYALVLGVTRACFDDAAELAEQGQVEALLIGECRHRRSERIGAIPRAGIRYADELQRRGVQPERIRVIATDAQHNHQFIRRLHERMHGEPLIVIVPATLSHYFRVVIDQSLPADQASQYRVRGVVSHDFDPDRWWLARPSVRQVLVHGLRLGFVMIQGESDVDPTDHYAHLIPTQVDAQSASMDWSPSDRETARDPAAARQALPAQADAMPMESLVQ